MPFTIRHLAQCGSASVLSLFAIATICAGCASRYVTRTEYLATDFNRASIRGRTVAVMPATDGAADDYRGELSGVARGMRDAGARVRLIDPPAAQPAAARIDASPSASPSAPPSPDRVALLADFIGDPESDETRRAARRWGREVDAQYVLFVRVTDDDVFHRFTPPHDAGTASRTSGRRVGLRLALVRLRDSAAVWVASGTGETWETRSGHDATAVAHPAGADTVDEDLNRGNLPLYPPPPPAQDLASGLTRRLLARVPSPVEIEPN